MKASHFSSISIININIFTLILSSTSIQTLAPYSSSHHAPVQVSHHHQTKNNKVGSTEDSVSTDHVPEGNCRGPAYQCCTEKASPGRADNQIDELGFAVDAHGSSRSRLAGEAHGDYEEMTDRKSVV